MTIANAPGNGVADDKAIYPYVPAMIEYYLGEEPILANVETYRLEDAEVCEWALERLDQLVFKPVDGSGGKGIVIGPRGRARRRSPTCGRRCSPIRAAGSRRSRSRCRPRRRTSTARMGAAPPRPAAVRGERRARRVGRARRAHAGRAPGGQPGRELEPGRRLEGHLGARRPPTSTGARSHPRRADRRRRRPMPSAAARRSARCPSRTRSSSSSNERHREAAVLSRIAESLYWIGRYIERAEDTARLLDVHYHLLLEDRRADEARGVRRAARRHGRRRAEPSAASTDAATVTALLAQDLTFSGSITCSVGAAWENARGAREAISSELWETLNTTYREVGSRARAGTGPARHEFFGWVRDRAAACNGIVDATMSRDDGWRFFVLGPQPRARRHDDAAAVDARYGDAFGRTGWTTTLRSCSAYEAYLRTYRHAVDAATRGRVPAARPAVPALGVPRAHHRRQQPRRARPALGARRRRRRSPPAPRPCPGRARVPPPRRGDGRPPDAARRDCSTSAPTCTRPSPGGTSARPV